MRYLLLVAAVAALLLPAPVSAQVEPPPEEPPPPTLPFFEPFETEGWHETWIDWRGQDDRNTAIGRGYHDNGLQVIIPPNERRGTGPLWRLPDDVDEAWFRYRLRLDDFTPITSGKLPGFAAIPNYTAKGCYPSTEQYPGWSARMLFYPAGWGEAEPDQVRIGYYTYHLDQPGTCGEFMPWDSDGILDQDWWYCIEGRIRVNTPGKSDGLLQGWVDNELAFDRDGLQFRRVGEDSLFVRDFWLDVYFGGSTIVNDRDLKLQIDDLAISETGRIGCPNRFSDDDGNQHEANIEWMFQGGYIYGCADDLYCPDRELTRAETAALLDRVVSPPGTTVDAFADDTGHWAEGALNRLAAAGIMRGCGPAAACPNDPVTRAQFAALVRRALDIPAAETDYFIDDAGIFEPDINAIAALGITRGCDAAHTRFCPGATVRRDEAATLLARAIQWWQSS